MVAANRGKSVDKQELCKKLQSLLKKHYTVAHLKSELPVLETLMYALCLEDSTPEQAEQAYARILNGFHDLNEVRVSSIYELETIFQGMSEPGWRSLRLKNVLHFVFESTFSFDFDGLKRKAQDQVVKTLTKINHLTPFARNFTLQSALGVHVVPIDRRMHDALAWLGLADPEADLDTNSDQLRSAVRKADAPQFCACVRYLALDPKYLPVFQPHEAPIHIPADETLARLDVLFKQGVAAARKLDVQRHAEAQKLWDAKVQAEKEAAERKAAKAAAKDARDAIAAEKALAAEKAAKSAARAAAKAQANAAKIAESHVADKKAVDARPADTKAHHGKEAPKAAAPTKVPDTKPHGDGKPQGDAKRAAAEKPKAKGPAAPAAGAKSPPPKGAASKAAPPSAKPSKPAPKKGK